MDGGLVLRWNLKQKDLRRILTSIVNVINTLIRIWKTSLRNEIKEDKGLIRLSIR